MGDQKLSEAKFTLQVIHDSWKDSTKYCKKKDLKRGLNLLITYDLCRRNWFFLFKDIQT